MESTAGGRRRRRRRRAARANGDGGGGGGVDGGLQLAAAPAAANCLGILRRLLRNLAEAAACDRATMQSRMQCVQSIHGKACVYCVPLKVL